MASLQGFEAVSPATPSGKTLLTVKQDNIHFNKGAVLTLGSPRYVRFLINPRTKQFAVQPCAANDTNAIAFCSDDRRASVTLKTPVLLDAVLKYFHFESTPDDEIAYAAMHGVPLDDEPALMFNVADAEYGVMKKRGRKKGSTLS